MASVEISKKDHEEVVIDLVQGIMPDSKNEYLLAVALDLLGIDYRFQYPLGSMGVRGSQVIDFIAYVAPAAKACFVQGSYWHNKSTETEDILKHAQAEHVFGIGNTVDFSEEETNTLEHAKQAARSKLL